jgi:glutathione S-transferase kappa 1
MWDKGNDVSKPEVLVLVLQRRLKKDEAWEVMKNASSAPYKQRLNDNTRESLDRGAFGCPWFFVRNSKGDEEPFFGSDRYVPSPPNFPIPTPCHLPRFFFVAGKSV